MDQQKLNDAVCTYWNRASCGTDCTKKEKFSRDYFEDIESFRYAIEPEIFSFAQFTRFKGKKVLEVGVGAGTDFLQWVRAGTQAYGIDLTKEAIANTVRRLQLEDLSACDLCVADAQKLPYQDDMFDLVYSWGVIHHAPDPLICLDEIVRVTKSNGTIKLMLYNRHSLFAFYRYLLCGVLKGRFFTRWSSVIFYHQESLGTKAYTRKEMISILRRYPVVITHLKATVSSHDLLYYKSKVWRCLAYLLACLCGWNSVGWFMTIELRKK